MSEPENGTVDAPGAVLHYDIRRGDVRPGDPGDGPVLLIIGSPMGADGALVTTVPAHADDLRRLIDATGGGRPTSSPAAAARSTRSP